MRPQSRSLLSLALTVSVSGIALSVLLATTTVPASAGPPPVGLGTAGSFAVLAGERGTNTGPSVINGDLGVSPGSEVTNFPPGLLNGAQHISDDVAVTAKKDLTTAYNDAAGRTPVTDKTDQDLGGQTLVAGVYKANVAMALTGTVTLDAENDPNAVFIFQAGSTLITASNSTVAVMSVRANPSLPNPVSSPIGMRRIFNTAATNLRWVLILSDSQVCNMPGAFKYVVAVGFVGSETGLRDDAGGECESVFDGAGAAAQVAGGVDDFGAARDAGKIGTGGF